MTKTPVRRALLSVSDKTGLAEFARSLHDHGVELISTGGTARMIAEAGLPVRDVAELTGYPEMMDGRVKTLHPAVHGGLLALLDEPSHAGAMAEHGIVGIDLLVVTLYPFEATVAKGGDFADCVENIDIGGPAMIRAGAKNWQHTAVVVDTEDYADILSAVADGGFDAAGRRAHQSAAFYRTGDARPGVATATLVQGKALSYNNINDADAAFELVSEFVPETDVTCAIIKHANPCGVATRGSLVEAYRHAGRIEADDLRCVTKRAPSDAELADLLFAWRVAKHVKSNAIVYAKDRATVGIGAGQMSRVDSTRIAARKAGDIAEAEGLDASPAQGSVVASDAFFPFSDGLLTAAQAGATAGIQPGGSMRDEEVIAAADEAGLAMVFTGMRHFRH